MHCINITFIILFIGHPYGVIHYGELVQNSIQSLQTATILCGGLSNLLYLFARVSICIMYTNFN